MLIIADNRIPAQAKVNLQKYGEVIWLETSDITEASISGHPDIFFCKTDKHFIIAPNLPNEYKRLLSDHHIGFVEGSKAVKHSYPEAAVYNAVITENLLIHKTDITDTAILNDCKDLKQINVRQGFARCSLLPLRRNHFITSDEGIHKTLVKKGFQALLVNSDEIILPGHSHGFIGGTCGILENKIFIIGSLSFYNDSEKIKTFISQLDYEIIELYNGPLFDGGSLIFI